LYLYSVEIQSITKSILMFKSSNLVDIFYLADEFCKEFYEVMAGHQLPEASDKKHRNKPSKLNDAEVITILIAFHLGGFRNLKHFYINYVKKHLQEYFPETVSYNRFVELQQKALKYISETTTNFIAEKISQLLNSGYSKVYLITDHGFVLTGILSEADKISVSIEGVHEKAERYIRTVERQHSLTNSYIGVEKKYENLN